MEKNISRTSQMRSVIEALVTSGVEFVPDAKEKGMDRAMFIRTLFGYIALNGTSRKTTHYGEVDVIGNKIGPGSIDARGKINVGNIVRVMNSFSKITPEGPAKGATLRQMCEPFAEEARECLAILASKGAYSQLASKLTKLGQKEPQVMFDFNGGLDLAKLSATEASTIQALNSRLFRTEGAKNVFTAQSSVGEQAVEI
ncbi:CP [Actinidia virus C]|nr:coat protein [Actinidia virus C]QJD14814.1 CP [Actinidia virus C]QJD14842.1 coat protein [Actinidia virus C]QJD14843.1 coat protein [Actinidia virus C]QJD14844.1 coat protein [Actinidia virus C]